MATVPQPVVQQSFDDLGTPLHSLEFVVVDLETTGGSAREHRITEIGAVKVRGGEVLGEFESLVNPGVDIPPFIAALTGITSAAVAAAPAIGSVLPSFLEFSRAGVLVAHNAGFDISFLRAACAEKETPWPGNHVLDTARLARVLLHRDEVRNHRLATLAGHFRATTTPTHRALADARATVDVFHGLLERAAAFGATTLEDVLELSSRISREQRRKRTLADGLPDTPGVYVFAAADGRSLYVGKSRSIRTRVRSYFTAAERRGRILEMVRLADHVAAIPCSSDLEAQVREVRLIAERRPPYNRRSRNPEKGVWLKLTDEPFPRLSLVSSVSADCGTGRGAAYAGPFTSRRTADQAREAVQAVLPLRTCTPRVRVSVRTSACLAADLGTCLAPCHTTDTHDDYRELADRTRRMLRGDASAIVETLMTRMSQLAGHEQFEQAARDRDRLRHLISGLVRHHDRMLLGKCPEIVAAAPSGRDWEVHVIRFGRLAGAGRVTPRDDPARSVDALVTTAEAVAAPEPGRTAALPEESALILAWLWSPGTRLIRLDGDLALPLTAPHRFGSMVPQPAVGDLPGA